MCVSLYLTFAIYTFQCYISESHFILPSLFWNLQFSMLYRHVSTFVRVNFVQPSLELCNLQLLMLYWCVSTFQRVRFPSTFFESLVVSNSSAILVFFGLFASQVTFKLPYTFPIDLRCYLDKSRPSCKSNFVLPSLKPLQFIFYGVT